MTSSLAPPARAQPDVSFVLEPEQHQAVVGQSPFHQWRMADGATWTLFYHLGGNSYLLRFPDLADFEVSGDGRRVRGWPTPGIRSPATVEHLYLNQVLPLALSRQGKLILHGSAIEIGDKAVAFIGESGRGKSTLVAGFARSGSRFLTDDGLQLMWDEDRLIAMPSHPSIRLWEDSQDVLVPEGSATTSPLQFTNKARFLAGPGLTHCDEPKPLAHVYFLGDGTATAPVISSFESSAAVVMALVRNSFLLDVGKQDMLAQHFTDISRIAGMPIHFHLDYPRHFEGLPAVQATIIQHVTTRAL